MKNGTRYPKAHLALACSLILAITVPCSARAQNADPFQDQGIWKSFDRYKEEQNKKLFSELTGDPDTDTKNDDIKKDTKSSDASGSVEAQGNSHAAPDDKKAADAAAEPHTLDSKPVATATEPVLAPPEHPIAVPAMPGLSSRFSLPVDTTDDDIKNTPHIADLDTDNPDIQLPKQNWIDAAQAAKLHAQGKDDDTAQHVVNIRLSTLPSLRPIMSHKKTQVAATPKPVPPPEPQLPAIDHAACAAIDAYKKQQLEAIKSDHQTLTALQAAIRELGLQKDLSFMAGADSKVGAQENGGMSAPVSP